MSNCSAQPKRWCNEYLVELRNAHRHSPVSHNLSREVKLGEVVLVHDDDLPRGQWKLAVIVSLFKGIDGRVRSASVRTLTQRGQLTTLNRPIQKLYPLEISASSYALNSNEPPTSDDALASRDISNSSSK